MKVLIEDSGLPLIWFEGEAMTQPEDVLRRAAEAMLTTVDRAFEGLAVRIPNPGQRRQIVNAAEVLRAALARPGHGSEYGRLLAERDRLIAEGVDPAELELPLAARLQEKP
jgi:hypothetical protein